MRRSLRYAGFAVAVGVAILAGWRIVATRVSDSLATTQPRRALSWDAGNPRARLALADRDLAARHPGRAATEARELLRRSPLQGDAFTVLGRAAAATGRTDAARRLFTLALRRAPRDQYARAWLIGDRLEHGAWLAALRDVSGLFNVAPGQQASIIPILTRVAAAEPPFATALGRFLANQPGWRNAMLGDLLAHAPAATVDQVFSALQAAHGLDGSAAGLWYARLEQDGRWGEAYGRWAGQVATGGQLALVYNGSFALPVTGIGFDWQMQGEPGVAIERVPISGSDTGYAAAVTFLRRRANDIGFQQLLLLAPGHYRLRFRASAQDLQSNKGLQWAIRCVGSGPLLGASPKLGGSFDWKDVGFDFVVPTGHCPAQRLALVNPGDGGAGKLVSGEIWFTGFEIAPASAGNPASLGPADRIPAGRPVAPSSSL